MNDYVSCDGYRVVMKTSADLRGCGPFAEATPAEVRAALPGEDLGRFDSEWQEVMARATETRDLAGVSAMLDRWRRVAWSFQDDPEAHRHMLDTAARLIAGEDVPTVPWSQVKADLGL
jgi:Family of unknown function (DUF6247)